MVECKNCGHWFRDNYKLNRHLDRLKPCINKNTQSVQNQGEQIHPSDEQIHPSDEQIHPSDEQFHPLDEQIHPLNKCVYCSNTFYNNLISNINKDLSKLEKLENKKIEIKMLINKKRENYKNNIMFEIKNNLLKLENFKEKYNNKITLYNNDNVINYDDFINIVSNKLPFTLVWNNTAINIINYN